MPTHDAVRQPTRPRPFVRRVETIVPPWDPTAMITVETLILAPYTRDDETSAGPLDLPELEEAGWHSVGTPVLDIYMRVIS